MVGTGVSQEARPVPLQPCFSALVAKGDAWAGAWWWSGDGAAYPQLAHLSSHGTSPGLALGWVSYEWLRGRRGIFMFEPLLFQQPVLLSSSPPPGPTSGLCSQCSHTLLFSSCTHPQVSACRTFSYVAHTSQLLLKSLQLPGKSISFFPHLDTHILIMPLAEPSAHWFCLGLLSCLAIQSTGSCWRPGTRQDSCVRPRLRHDVVHT